MIQIYFMQADTPMPMPMNGMVCYVNASNFHGKCVMQYWKRGHSLWKHSFEMPDEFVEDSMDKIVLGLNFSGPKPLSEKAQQWVMQQAVYIPLHIQIIEGMRITGTTIDELNTNTGIRAATISDFLTQKTQMNAKYVDEILGYITLHQK